MSHSYPFPSHVLPTFITDCSTDECCDLLLDALVFTDFWVATHGFRQFLSREMHRALIPASSSSNFTRVTHALAVFISPLRNCHVSGSGLLHSHDPLHHFDNGLFQSTSSLLCLSHVWRRLSTIHNIPVTIGSHRSCLLNRSSRSAISVTGLIASLYDGSIGTPFCG